jgi:hypothetical protein
MVERQRFLEASRPVSFGEPVDVTEGRVEVLVPEECLYLGQNRSGVVGKTAGTGVAEVVE